MATFLRCSRILNLKPNFVKCINLKNNILQSNIRHIHKTSFLLERKFSEKHEWIEVSGGIGTIGISDFAQDQLGDVVYAQLPEVGSEFDQDDECGALESVKAASEIYTPVSGTVTESNSEVENKPALINQDCYGKGWLFKVELSKPVELNDLMDEAGYTAFIKAQQDE